MITGATLAAVAAFAVWQDRITIGDWDPVEFRGRHVFFWMEGPRPDTIWIRHERTRLIDDTYLSSRILIEVRCDGSFSRTVSEEFFVGQNLTDPHHTEPGAKVWEQMDPRGPHGTAVRRHCGDLDAQAS